MIKNYRFNDIVLYAKGWYQRKDLIEDLGYLLSQVYGYSINNEEEVAMHMLRILDNLYDDLHISSSCGSRWLYTHVDFELEVRKRMRLYDCSRDHAIILSVLSILLSLSNYEIELNPPYYGKHEYFRLGCIGRSYPISMTYTHMNRMAEKVFGRASEKKTEEVWRKAGIRTK